MGLKRDKEIARMTKRLPLKFSVGESESIAFSSNISNSGLFIRTRKAYPPGTKLKISLEADNNNTIELEGEVAWSLKTGSTSFKNGMGIKLSNIPQSYIDLVKKLGL
jgi:uncharacterized protein (TIGR02266 family)